MGDGIPVKREDIYGTIDQRVLGSEEYLDSVMEKYDGELKTEKREREYTLSEISKGVEKITGVTLKQIRVHNKTNHVTMCRKLFILLAKEYGYKGREIADYINRDPAAISTALKNRYRMAKDMELVIRSLKNLNF